MESTSRSNLYESQSITKPLYFNGDNYPYWKNRIRLLIKSNDYQVWNVVEDGPFIPMKKEDDWLITKIKVEMIDEDRRGMQINDKVMHMLFCALGPLKVELTNYTCGNVDADLYNQNSSVTDLIFQGAFGAPSMDYLEEIATAAIATKAKNYGNLEHKDKEFGKPPLLLQYLDMLLSVRKLNVFESLKLSLLDLNQNKKHLLKKCWVVDKLECSEELGDLVNSLDDDLTLQNYIIIRETLKLVAAPVDCKEFDFKRIFEKLFPRVEYSPNDLSLLETILCPNPNSWIFPAAKLAIKFLFVDFNQVAFVHKPKYALARMMMALVDLLRCMIELGFEGSKEKSRWRWDKEMPWFYCLAAFSTCVVEAIAPPLYPMKLAIMSIPNSGTNPIQSVEKVFLIARAGKDLLTKQDYSVLH